MACGFDDQAFQSRGPLKWYVCDACGCDLYARPPRSYQEMEGIEPAGPSHGGVLRRLLRAVIRR